MTETTDAPTQAAPKPLSIPVDEVLGKLRELLHGEESAPSRVAAAKILLERIAPKEDDELRRREADERAGAIADAKGILAEYALAKSHGLFQPLTLVEDRQDQPDYAGVEV